MHALSKLFEALHLTRKDKLSGGHYRRRRRTSRRSSFLSCETLESKQLLAADVAQAFVTIELDTTDPVTVAIEGKFQENTVSGTVVKFETNAPVSDSDIYIELTSDTPLTNGNFLQYVNNDDYDNTFFHRSVDNFVLQGGGFTAPTIAADQAGSDPVAIVTRGTVQNEPGNLNTRGTISMAKLGGQPDSATSQFFFNLSDNSFLDSDNGGYTAFGDVLGSGMTVVDTMASALTYDAGTYYSNTALSDLPLWNINQDNIVRPQDFLKIENADVVTESDLMTYVVSSSDVAKLTASFDGNGDLVLTPVGSASGSVNVTVTATSKLDNTTASDTFSVQLNGGGGGPVLTPLTPAFTDDFSRTDGADVTQAGWNVVSGGATLSGNALVQSTTGETVAVVDGLAVENSRIQAAVDMSTSKQVGLVTRVSGTGAKPSLYLGYLVKTSGGTRAEIWRRLTSDAGASSWKLLGYTNSPATSGTLQFDASGSTLSLSLDGSEVLSVEDAQYGDQGVPTTGTSGVWLKGATGASVSSFSVAELAPPSSLDISLRTDSGDRAGDGVTTVGTIDVAGLADGASWRWSADGGSTWNAGAATSFELPLGTYAAGQVQVEQLSPTTTSYQNKMRLVVSEESLAALTPAFTDDFSRTDGADVTQAGWNVVSGGATLSGNALVQSTTGETVAVVDGLAVENSRIQAAVDMSTSKQVGLVTRVSGTGAKPSLYLGYLVKTSGGTRAEIWRRLTSDAGASSWKLLGYTNSPATSGTLQFDASGSTLSLSLDGSEVLSVEDAQYGDQGVPTTGTSGVWLKGATGASVSSFSVAELAPPSSLDISLRTDSGDRAGDGVTTVGTIDVAGLADGASWRWSADGGSTWNAGAATSFELPLGTYAAGQVQVEQLSPTTTSYQNKMRLVVSEESLAALTPAFTDDFSRTDGADVTQAGWNVVSGGATLSGNALVQSTTGETVAVVDGLAVENSRIQAAVDMSTSKQVGLVTRVSGTGAKPSLYLGYLVKTSGGTRAEIWRRLTSDAGASSWKLLGYTNSPATSGTLQFDASGSTLSLSLDGSEVLSVEDAQYGDQGVPTTGTSGVWLKGATGASVSSFSVAELAPPSSLDISLRTDSGDRAGDGVTTVGTIDVAGLADGASWRWSADGGSTWNAGAATSFELPLGTYAAGQVQVEQLSPTTTSYQNKMRLVVSEESLAALTPAFTDDFSRTDGADVTQAGWNVVSGGATLSGNALVQSTTAETVIAVDGLAVENSRIQAAVDMSTSKQVGLVTRVSGTGAKPSLYLGYLVKTSGGTRAEIWRRITSDAGASSWKLLGSTNSPATSGTLQFDASGSTLSLSLDGSEVLSAEDAQYGQQGVPTTGTSGVWLKGATGASVSSFSVAELAPPSSLDISLRTDSGDRAGDGVTTVGTIDVAGLADGASWRWSADGGSTWNAGAATSFELPLGTYAAGQVQVEQLSPTTTSYQNKMRLVVTSNTPLFVDNFDQLGSELSASNWTVLSGSPSVDQNKLTQGTTALETAVVNDINTANLRVQAEINMGSSKQVGLLTRVSGDVSDPSFYLGYLLRTSNGIRAEIWRKQVTEGAASWKLLGYTTTTKDSGLMSFDAQNGTFTLSIDGEQLLSANEPLFGEADISQSGSAGVWLKGILGSSVDDFAIYSI